MKTKGNETIEKPEVVTTTQILPFKDLPWENFEHLVLCVIETSREFDNVSHCGGTGDGGKDVIAYKHVQSGIDEKWYISIKRYKDFSFTHAEKEINRILEYCKQEAIELPDTVIIAVACNVTLKTKTDTSKHGNTLGFKRIYFWTEKELDAKVKMHPEIKRNFFNSSDDKVLKELENIGKLIIEGMPGRETIKMNDMLTKNIKSSSEASNIVGVTKDLLNSKIDNAVELINLNKMIEARTELLELLGEIKTKESLKKELYRVYNNLGVTYNFIKPIGDFDEAIRFFHLALEIDPHSVKSRRNLASAYINKENSADWNRGFKIISEVWVKDKDFFTLYILLLSILKIKSAKKALEFIEKGNGDIENIIDSNPLLMNLVAAMYLELKEHKIALEIIEKALKTSPDLPELLEMKGNALLLKAQEGSIPSSDFNLLPHFETFEEIHEALRLFNKAEEITITQHKKYLLPNIYYGKLVALIWLGEYEEAGLQLKFLNQSGLEVSPLLKHQIETLNFTHLLVTKDFEQALKIIKESNSYQDKLFNDKRYIAGIFRNYGALEQAKIIFEEIQKEAENNNEIGYWLDLSSLNVLLGNKVEAISSINKARSYLNKNQFDDKVKKIVLGHYNAVMLRYSVMTTESSKEGEQSRFAVGLMEYHKEFPDDKMVDLIQVLDDKGEVTEKFKDIWLNQKKWYENIKNIFKNQYIPTYYLEKVFNRSYVDIINFREFDFHIQFSNPNIESLEEQNNIFTNSNGFIFDYLSLLDLSKMGLLSLLKKIPKPLYVHESLFNKIQNELQVFESKELRNLWDFLRKDKSIKIIHGKPEESPVSESFSLFLDNWLSNTAKICKLKKYVFISNDLRLCGLFGLEKVQSINILPILQFFLSNKDIDQIMYSKAIGVLAERFYVFISFSYNDLFEIVMEDSAKITPRSYHLIQQIHLPSSNIDSFTNVFVGFIQRLWQTSVLASAKASWLKYLTDTILKVIHKITFSTDPKLVEAPVSHFFLIWEIASKSKSKEELEEVLKVADEVLSMDGLIGFKETIKKQITDRLNALQNP